jgi:hypothetical protein
MEQIGVMHSGNPINFGDKVKTFFKSKKDARKNNFNDIKEKVSSEFFNRKVSLETALIDSGSLIFCGSPLESNELEDILFEFVIENPYNLDEVKIKPDKKIKNWKSYFEKFDNPKIDDFFNIENDGLLKLTHEGIKYVENIVSKYKRTLA